MQVRTLIARISAVAVVLAVVTITYRRLFLVNPTTVALTFLVLVLLASAFWGFRIALFAAFAATTVFNFFFLPPVGTFTISDPQNWIALFAFLITAVVASDLAERARRQAELAQQRRLDVERLYALSQRLLTSDNPLQLFNLLPGHVAQTFGASGVAFVVSGREPIYRSRPELEFDTELLLGANARGEISEVGGVSYVPLRIGVKPAGALAIVGVRLSRATQEAIGSLVGIASERARAIEELASTRAAQENEKLRSALLDSLTHEFRTPLTSIKASVTGLLEENALDPAQQRDLLSVIDEEADRLNRLVGEAAEMAQLDAQMFRLEKSLHPVKDVVEAAMENVRGLLESHPPELNLPSDLPEVSCDFDRICEVLTHLLENAAKYSPKGSPIQISAEHRPNQVVISVADRGSGIDPLEQSLIFEKFYRGREQRLKAQGTGMGLAISKVIVEAHDGSLSLVSQPGNGSVFSVHLPVNP
jgi:two-component system sensor histidine kinase KdpD